ncbi:MAG: TonB-dependent receptor [Bacteroidota bacterium]
MWLRLSVGLLILALFVPEVQGQASVEPARSDTTIREVEMAPVVVTATRSVKSLEDVAVPTTVVTAATMRQQGAIRLSEVLAALPGLQLFDDHGTGLQVQGFSPDYTLILIDGEPVVGRTAGTLSLDRLAVHGVERVEIVRGPSSSLYGSEALAGVVNLITAAPREEVSGLVDMRAGSFETTDLSATLEGGSSWGGVRLFVNRYASGGYDLAPEDFGQTAPSFVDHTADLRANATVTDRLRLRLGARLAVEDYDGNYATPNRADGGEIRFDDVGQRTDWSLHPEAELRLSDRFRLTGILYGAGYQTKTRHRRQTDGVTTYADDFDQRLLKAETQVDALWSAQHLTTFGGGLQEETLGGDRYDGPTGSPAATQGWAFVQHEWLPSRRVEVSASARLDAHTDYATRLSPKLAVLVRPTERIRLRASIGSGFKAPAFRQLYLSFTNAAAGYSVFGTTRVAEGLSRLEAEGQIDEIFFAPSNLEPIRAEQSVAYNVGGTVDATSWLSVSANAFLNDVTDLIETQPIARKTNGQSVFGYFNLARIYTRGLEAEATARPFEALGLDLASQLELSVGYQFLQARDRAVVDALNEGTVFGRDTNGRDYRLDLSDYGGLFGRSPHSATAQLTYTDAPRDLVVSVRSRWRSRYGYRDLDGNQVANRDDEFVPAYALFDATVTKGVPVPGRLDADLQLGVDNLFDLTRGVLVSSLPGRRLYAALRFSL